MGHSKKHGHRPKASKGIVASVREAAQRLIEQQQDAPAPKQIAELSSLDPAVREAACQDISSLCLVPANLALFIQHNAHGALVVLLGDTCAPVRVCAATALRNIITSAGDVLIDELLSNESGVGQIILERLYEAFRLVVHGIDPSAATADTTVEELRECAIQLVDELLQLATVMIEAHEGAAASFSSSANFLTLLLESLALPCESVGIAAAECLHVLSADNPEFAAFMSSSSLTPEQQNYLNSCIDAVTPTSSSHVLRALHLSGVLLNIAPSVVNMSRVVPVLRAALAVAPHDILQNALQIFSAGCTLDDVAKAAAIRHEIVDRFRALQTAFGVLGDLLGALCEFHDNEVDDEAAFQRNPHAAMVTESGLLVRLLEIGAVSIPPIQDALLLGLLRGEETETSRVDPNLQQLRYLSCSTDVGLLSVLSSVLVLVPLQSIGDAGLMWRTCISALRSRFDSIGTTLWPAHVAMQMESLCEICWTIARKDTLGCVVADPHDLDLFTRYAWSQHCSSVGRVFIVGCTGCLAQRMSDPQAVFAASNFLVRLMARCVHGDDDSNPELEVATEIANVIMDIFSDERFDTDVYVPLEIQKHMHSVLPRLKSFAQQLRRAGDPTRAHVAEVASNVAAFLQYKAAHVR